MRESRVTGAEGKFPRLHRVAIVNVEVAFEALHVNHGREIVALASKRSDQSREIGDFARTARDRVTATILGLLPHSRYRGRFAHPRLLA